MQREPGIFEQHDEQAEWIADQQALVEFQAGRFYDHARVAGWLRTWGKPGRVSFSEWLAANG